MFGLPPHRDNGATPPLPPAADVARIEGGGLVQLLVTQLSPFTFFLFLNDQAVEPMEVESLSVDVEAQEDSAVVRATLSRYVTNVTGEKVLQRTELFPCTLEIIALKRRIVVVCMEAGSLDSTQIRLGLKPNGEDTPITGGLQGFRFLLTAGIVDAKLTWEDGTAEDLLPQ